MPTGLAVCGEVVTGNTFSSIRNFIVHFVTIGSVAYLTNSFLGIRATLGAIARVIKETVGHGVDSSNNNLLINVFVWVARIYSFGGRTCVRVSEIADVSISFPALWYISVTIFHTSSIDTVLAFLNDM